MFALSKARTQIKDLFQRDGTILEPQLRALLGLFFHCVDLSLIVAVVFMF
jgi:hypothetical protein